MPPSKILESRRGCTGGGASLPSEKPNHPSKCGQSEYERDEIELLLCAPNPPLFGVALTGVLEVGIRWACNQKGFLIYGFSRK
jgi:hypothetical protein